MSTPCIAFGWSTHCYTPPNLCSAGPQAEPEAAQSSPPPSVLGTEAFTVKVIEGGLGGQTQAGPHRAKLGPAQTLLTQPQRLCAAGSVPAGLQLPPTPSGEGLFIIVVDFELYKAPELS